MDTGSQELNACAECGFTTRDWALFARHVERHENGGTFSRKTSKTTVVVPQQTTTLAAAGITDGSGGTDGDGEEEEEEVEEADFQHFFDLALPKIEEDLDTAAANNCLAEDEMIIGRLADLSRFLSARSDNSSASPVDLSMAAAAASEKRPKMDNGEEMDEEEEEEEGEENGEGTDKKSCSPEADARHKIKNRPKATANGTGGAGTGKTTHKCPHCTFTTYMSQHMKSHLRAHENFIGQMYVCDVCGMAFSQKANMHRHRGTHSGVKPYECRFCQKRFFRKDQMQEHSMTHIKTGDDFDCPVAGCESKFSQHSLLRQHLDERHAISASQQAHCKRCTMQFGNSRRLLLHYQTKHDEYYSAVSPVPDGHSPVKRLVVNNNSNGGTSSSSECGAAAAGTNRGGTAAAAAVTMRPCSAASAPTTMAGAGAACDTTSATTPAKRRSRKRTAARRQRSTSGGGGGGRTLAITAGGGGDGVMAMYNNNNNATPNNKMVMPMPPIGVMSDEKQQQQQQRRAVTTTTSVVQPSPATQSSPPPNGWTTAAQNLQHQHQQQCAFNGYNVEELLRLNCAGANAAAHDTKLNGIIGANQAMFKMSPVSSPAGFELFREQMLRNTSIFAHQLGNVPPSFTALPMAHRGQNQMAAAAAHLFMHSFLLPPQQYYHQQGTHHHTTTSASSSSSAAAVGRHQNQGLPNPPLEEEPPGPTISPKHMPLAKSPDCRGLVLHGFNNAAEREEGTTVGWGGPKLEKQQDQPTTRTAPTTTTTAPAASSSCTPPMLINNNSSSCCSNVAAHDGHAEEEGSDSEAPISESTKNQFEQMDDAKNGRHETSERYPSATTPPPPAVPKSNARHGPSSAHSSTTHSPSSASSSASSVSSHGAIVGGESTASSLGVANGGGGGTSVENSPLKDLNNKLLSRALMNASVSSSASGGAVAATASDGILLKGLMMQLEPSSSLAVPAGDMDCAHCGLMFSDQTLYLLHKGLHSEADPWRCNLCGHSCSDKYTFTTHMISSDHS